MARRYIIGAAALLPGLVLTASVGLTCSSSPPRDINFGTDAGANFEIPPREVASDTSGGTGGAGGTGGTGGTAGTGDDGSVGGAGGDSDAASD